MNLKENIIEDLSQAMRDGDKQRRDVLRLMMAAIKQVEVDQRISLDDPAVESVLRKEVKMRQESIVDFQKAERTNEVERERAEIAVIETYLPQLLTKEEIEAVARQVIADTGASSLQDMGPVMGQVMGELKGRGDGRVASEVVHDLLSQ